MDNSRLTKICACCREEKSITDFPRRRKNKIHPYCRLCINKKSKEFYNKHKERYVDVRKKWIEKKSGKV